MLLMLGFSDDLPNRLVGWGADCVLGKCMHACMQPPAVACMAPELAAGPILHLGVACHSSKSIGCFHLRCTVCRQASMKPLHHRRNTMCTYRINGAVHVRCWPDPGWCFGVLQRMEYFHLCCTVSRQASMKLLHQRHRTSRAYRTCASTALCMSGAGLNLRLGDAYAYQSVLSMTCSAAC